MISLRYRRHRFPSEMIQHAMWLYLRFTLSHCDVEELLADRGLDISYETVRRRVLKFGPSIVRWQRPPPSDLWHLDKMVVRIAGGGCYPGVPSITRVRSLTCWSSAGAMTGRRCG
jgi:transposase-like protein